MNNISNYLKNNGALIAILFVAFILRIYHIDYQSMWVDEIFSYKASNPTNSFSEIYTIIKSDGPHPPLYYFLLKITFHLFGYSSFSMRFLSVIVGVLSILYIYKLGKEILNKNLGLISAILLTINPFHIEYSQEGRMYSLLTLLTILSFFYLIKFLKNNSIKNFAYYILFTFLMIYTHLFGVFTLISQYIIYIIFIFIYKDKKLFNYIKYLLIGGVILALTYIPVFIYLFKNKDRNDSWIPIPSDDFINQLIKDFFGRSEILSYLFIIFVVYYIFTVFKSKKLFSINTSKLDLNNLSLILITWILITFLIPYYISFTKIPILVNRYLINILPAILIIFAMGLLMIKNKITRNLTICLIIFCSFSQIFLIKKYYTQPNKSQFREVSEFIIKNNSNKNQDYISNLAMYYDVYLNKSIKKNFIQKDLDSYISEVSHNTNQKKSFWYADGHNNQFKPNENTLKFLDENYILDYDITLFGSWAKHYIPTDDYRPEEINLLEFKQNSNIKAWIETLENNDNKLLINGWGFLENLESKDSKANFILINDNKALLLPVELYNRSDITQTFGSDKYIFSGVKTNFSIKKIPNNLYTIGILIKNGDKLGYYKSDKTIIINN